MQKHEQVGEKIRKFSIHDNKYLLSYGHEVESPMTATHLGHDGLCATRHEKCSRKQVIFPIDYYVHSE